MSLKTPIILEYLFAVNLIFPVHFVGSPFSDKNQFDGILMNLFSFNFKLLRTSLPYSFKKAPSLPLWDFSLSSLSVTLYWHMTQFWSSSPKSAAKKKTRFKSFLYELRESLKDSSSPPSNFCCEFDDDAYFYLIPLVFSKLLPNRNFWAIYSVSWPCLVSKF